MVVIHCITRFNQGGTVTWLNNLLVDGDRAYLVFGTCSDKEPEGTPNANFDLIKVPTMRRSLSLLNDLASLLALVQILRRVRPDLLVTHTFKAGLLARVAKKLSLLGKSTKVIHTYHGHLQYGYFPRFFSKLISLIEKVLQVGTDGFIVNGYKVSRELLQVGLLKKPYVVILPGVKVEPDQHVVRYQRDESNLTIGWLGRLSRIKRPDRVLIQARRFPHVRFLMGGEGELESELRSLAPSNLEFLGWIPPHLFWPKVDIGLLTSDNEAAPFSLVEAAIYGVPCVATDVGSVSDVILDGVTGFLAAPTDDAISEKLLELVNDEERRASISAATRERARREFTVQNFRRKHLDFFTSILNS